VGGGLLRPSSRPCIDPIVFFKLQLIFFFEGLRSERQLIETASLHLAHRWYLGYDLDEPLPDHSSLTRIRQRLGLAAFERFYERVIELCMAAGLVWGKELFIDATKVRANADVDSLVPASTNAPKSICGHCSRVRNRPKPQRTTSLPPSKRERRRPLTCNRQHAKPNDPRLRRTGPTGAC
jgi:transposase